MIPEKFIGEDLIALQQEKGNICVSVIVPTHQLSPERRTDALAVQRAIHAAVQMLEHKYGDSKAKPLAAKLYELSGDIDFDHNQEGIGLYVSPGFKRLVRFPFPVKEKIIVGDSFEVRDLLYKISLSESYYVLLITEKEIKLLQGSSKELSEITEGDFPLRYKDEYEYNPPARSTSNSGYAHVKSFEKEKDVIDEIRYKSFFRKADKLLGKYILGNTPLILTGPGKEPGWFEKISGFKKNIIEKIKGSYGHHSLDEIAALTWPAITKYLQNKTTLLLQELDEKIGKHLALSGLEEVWQMAKEGKGLKLLVEKDYRRAGFIDKDAYRLYLRPPKFPHSILADAVDDLIETVLEKNGQVFLTDNEILKDYQHIAMITRY